MSGLLLQPTVCREILSAVCRGHRRRLAKAMCALIVAVVFFGVIVQKNNNNNLSRSGSRPTPSATQVSAVRPSDDAEIATENAANIVRGASNAATHNSSDCAAELRRPLSADILRRRTYWQVGQLDAGSAGEVVVYSAFFDDRPIVGRLPWLRVLGVQKLVGGGNTTTSVYCQVWYTARAQPHVVGAVVVTTGREYQIADGSTYDQRMFSCPLSAESTPPSHVSLVARRCDAATMLLDVTRPERPTSPGAWTHEFSLCIDVNYGSFPAEELVEWIEANALFGVSRFYIYDGNITDSTTIKVLEHYSRRGLVEFRPMPPPVDDWSFTGIRLASPASLNDCMLRSMYTSRFVVTVDTDELIVPRLRQMNYTGLVAHVDRTLNITESYHTYSFRNAYFFVHFPADNSRPQFQYLKTLRLRHRAPPSGYLFGAKSFVDPRRCLSIFNHYCWIRFPNSAEFAEQTARFGIGVDVPTSDALSHHYRISCPFEKDACDAYDRDRERDDVMLTYRVQLMDRVTSALTAIGLPPKTA